MRKISATLTETLTVKRVVEFEVPDESTDEYIKYQARQLGYETLAVPPENPWELSGSDGLDIEYEEV